MLSVLFLSTVHISTECQNWDKSEKQLTMGSMIGVYIPTDIGLFIMLQHPDQLSEPPTFLLNGNLRTLVQKLKPEGLAGSTRVKNVWSFTFICLHGMVLRLSQLTKFYIQCTKCLMSCTSVSWNEIFPAPYLNKVSKNLRVQQYLLTYSMVQSPSWEANTFAASQEIPRILWNLKVHYRTHKLPPPVPILG